MFIVQATRACLRGKHQKGTPLEMAPALLVNISSGRRGACPGQTLKLIGLIVGDEEKSFIRSPPVPNVMRLFTAKIYKCS